MNRNPTTSQVNTETVTHPTTSTLKSCLRLNSMKNLVRWKVDKTSQRKSVGTIIVTMNAGAKKR